MGISNPTPTSSAPAPPSPILRKRDLPRGNRCLRCNVSLPAKYVVELARRGQGARGRSEQIRRALDLLWGW